MLCATQRALFLLCGTAAAMIGASGQTQSKYLALPLAFEQDTGAHPARYVARGDEYQIALLDGKALLSSGGATVSMVFAGARHSAGVPGQELPGKVNYFQGANLHNWKLGLPTYGRITYRGIYPGIDAVFYGNQRQLEFDIVVKAGADAGKVRLKFGGTAHPALAADGSIAVGDLRVALPVVYQETGGDRKRINGKYRILANGDVAFQVGTYDRAKPLVIDPTIVYSKLIGGYGGTHSNAVAMDSNGNIYIAGSTTAADLPIVNSPFPQIGTGFLTKISPSGDSVLFSAYIGGSGFDTFRSIAVDPTGAILVTGMTTSSDFPTVPFQGRLQSGPQNTGGAVVLKLDVSGNLVYSTYLGWSSEGRGIACDSSGSAYVTGAVGGPFYATPGAFLTVPPDGSDAFAAKFSPSGTLVYSTYLGGLGVDTGNGIAVDAGGNAYIAGSSSSTTFTGAPGGGFRAYNSSPRDGFVAKLNSSGSALVYFTFLGGSGTDDANAIAVDPLGSAYVAGSTQSANFTITTGALQKEFGGASDGFVVKLNAAGSGLLYSTYLGGSHNDSVSGIAIDSAGNANITGSTSSDNFPTAQPLQGVTPSNQTALFVTNDSGATWTPFDLHLPGTVTDILPDPSDSNVLVAVTNTGTYRTVDGGATWSMRVPQLYSLSRSRNNGNTLYGLSYAGGDAFSNRSTDGGLTWTTGGRPSVIVTNVLADPFDPNTAYSYWNVGPQVQRTMDGGATWTTSASINGFIMLDGADGSIYLDSIGSSTNPPGLYKSSDQGTSWNLIARGIMATVNGLTISGTTPSVLYEANLSKTVRVSRDAGQTWTPVTSDAPERIGAVSVSPFDPNILFALAVQDPIASQGTPSALGPVPVYISTDGGATWHAASNGLGTAVVSQIVFDRINRSKAYAIANVNPSAFVSKINPTGSGLVYSSYLGSSEGLEANGIAVNPAGDALVTGSATGQMPGASFSVVSMTQALIMRITSGTPGCSYTVTPSAQVIFNNLQPATFTVQAPAGCGWTTASNQSWTNTTLGASGFGSGIVSVWVAANASAATRTATLTIAGQSVTLTQPSYLCDYSFNPANLVIGPAGGTLNLGLSVSPGCPWTASSSSPGVSFSPPFGTGSAQLSIFVPASASTSARYLPIDIVSIPMTLITQEGTCVSGLSLSASGATMGATGGSGSFAVTLNGDCGWAPVSNAPWLTPFSQAGSLVTGSGTVNYSVAPNSSGSPRSAVIGVGSKTFVVTQATASSCFFSLSTPAASLANGSGIFASLTGNVPVTQANCGPGDTWSAVSDSPRLTITSGGNFAMLTNSTTRPKTAHITVSGIMSGLPFSLTFTVNQAGSTEPQLSRAVRALYQTILGREPDSGGFNFWTGPGAPTANGGVLINQMADRFYTSPEFQGSGYEVLSIYQAVGERLPIFSEWAAAVGRIRNNSAAAAQLVDSISAAAALTANRTFVEQVFSNAFGRPATFAEASQYADQLNNGGTRLDFLNNVIFASPEFQRRTNPAFVKMLFFTILVREPDTGGFQFWLDQATNPPGQAGIYYVGPTTPVSPAYLTKLAIIGQAAPPNPVLLGFLGSPEFQSLIQ